VKYSENEKRAKINLVKNNNTRIHKLTLQIPQATVHSSEVAEA
jgi:hypothetical protein